MKKHYLLALILSGYALISQAQFTVAVSATNSSVCLGNSSDLTATASPIGYSTTGISYAPIDTIGMTILTSYGVGTPDFSQTLSLILDDSRWNFIPIGFNFTYFGNSFSDVNISTNGWMELGGNTNSITNGLGQFIPSVNPANNVIFAMGADLNFKTSGTIGYKTIGAPGSRKFVLIYKNVYFKLGTISGPDNNVEIILNEGANTIEIYTGAISNTTVFKSQGIENSAGSAGTASPGKNLIQNWGGTQTAVKFVPETISYSWSPSTGLSGTSGQTVTATPSVTTTYTVTATNSIPNTANNTVTVTVNPGSFTLAGAAGGSSISQNISVDPAGTYYRDMSNCNLISYILPSGVNPVNNSINVSDKVDNGATKRGTPDLYLARKYDLEPIAFASTATADVTLYFLQSEFDNFNLKASDSGHKSLPIGPADATGISNLVIRQFHGTGTAPGNYTGATVDFTTATSGFTVIWNAARNWWEVKIPVTGFSGFFITSKKIIGLPIKLEYFTGTKISTGHLLNWKVNCTSLEAKFEIERSGDGIHFGKIGSLSADALRCNQPFDFTDVQPVPGVNYYRLKIIDVDGKFAYSNTVSLTERNKNFNLLSINPNPVGKENAKLQINAGDKNDLILVIADFSGRVIIRQQAAIQQGINTIEILTSGLVAGTYQLSAISTEEKSQTIRFMKL